MHDTAVTVSTTVQPLLAGLALGTQFSPFASLVGAPIAAALCGFPRAGRDRVAFAGLAVVLAWLAGDGLQLVTRAGGIARGGPGLLHASDPAFSSWLLLGAWALAGLLAGYALPAWAGAFVGRRVVRGTGWASAAVIALAAAGGVQALLGPFEALARAFDIT